jgi:hypothetical protein
MWSTANPAFIVFMHKNTQTEVRCKLKSAEGLKTGLHLSRGGFLQFGGELEFYGT